MRERTPSARAIGPAVLRGFVLRWNKRSTRDGPASAASRSRPEDLVWGVKYEVNAEDKNAIDRFEGLGAGYEERRVVVEFDGGPVEAWAHYATDIDPTIKPYDWYRDLVIGGAREHSLPEVYIRELEAVPVMEDADRERAGKMRALLAKMGIVP